MTTENPITVARKELKLSKTEMARRLGVNLSTVWRWEHGQLPIGERTLKSVELLKASLSSGEAA